VLSIFDEQEQEILTMARDARTAGEIAARQERGVGAVRRTLYYLFEQGKLSQAQLDACLGNWWEAEPCSTPDQPAQKSSGLVATKA